jgi:hypothetical protein
VLVVALTVALTIVGGVMVSAISNNDPILKQASIQRYAYRALQSGLNAYQSAINANPYLAACNSNTNAGQPAAQAQCAGINYQTWSQVPGTDTGNGVIPEYYKFDNPQQIEDPSTFALDYLEVQIVGSAGFPGKNVSYSTVAKFTPANGFLDNVWWTNFESVPNNGAELTHPTPQCTYYYNGYSLPSQCTPVYFDGQDNLTGPVFSNDSIYADGPVNIGASYGVTTADPSCLFVEPGVTSGGNNLGKPPSPLTATNNCAKTASGLGITYSTANSSFGASNYEPIPVDNQSLANFAQQGGCYYTGPTQITLYGNKMTVLSPGTPVNGSGSSSLNFTSDTSTCPIDGTTMVSLPANGVIFADQDASPVANANPFDGVTQTYTCHGQTCTRTIDSQTIPGGCTGCYYGQTNSPDSEGDAFVSGSLSGHLTVAANNDVVIDGPLTYADCKWGASGTGIPSQTNCQYNDATTGINDTLGLIAYKYVEVSNPVTGPGSNANTLAACSSTNPVLPPLCNPSTPTGNGNRGQGLQIDASLLGLQQSFIVNNYSINNPYTFDNTNGQLVVYGSIQQDARGPVAEGSGSSISVGYAKQYLWDPRLPLYSPPFYLSPGTPSWALASSAESYTGKCPAMPPVQGTPTFTQPTWPASGVVPSGWSACVSAS